ncbi:hypothetical protein [Motiliproteus sp. SC1-56]|uniref:hypothetical protein n=1 Tax=Motiliproteus sp. SC1-56 TaxID=2799565 RepID=UPI001A8FCB64|nr:hypothetical protein [Motiliproteus sp. SC1-56]
MKGNPRPLARFSTQALFFILGALALSWPLLASPGEWALGQLFLFLFLVWGLLVTTLFAVAQQGGEDV